MRNGDIRLQSFSSLKDVEKSLELAASLGKTGEMEAAAPQSLSPGELSLFISKIKVVSHLRRARVSLAIRLRLSLTTRLTSDSSDTAMSSGK